MANIKNRRRKYLINRKLQMQFAWLLVVQAAIPIIILGSSLYIVNKMYLLSIQRIVGNTVILDADIQGILNFSMLAMAALLLITALLLIFIGIRFSHHIAGPLYKLEETISRLAKGEKVEPIYFRKTDMVNGLASKLNEVIKRFNLGK